ncbi:MAG: ABC transporter ATP-binding protein [Chitinophagaceae bacterium]
MTISLSDAGKRFNRDWIFRHASYQFDSGNSYAITGPNGSGKSTLLQVLSGATLLNEGRILFSENGLPCREEDIHRKVSICAPYLELVEEMTLMEFLRFHLGFKSFLPGITPNLIISAVGLEKAVNKQLRYYSSGMKQRVKLAQCIFSDTDILLLDEPCTNLDKAGIDLYKELMEQYGKKRLVVVSSNDHQEYDFCDHTLNITDWK